MDKPKLKQYWIETSPDIELDLEVTEKEFGPWILATEAAPIYEEMWKEIESLRGALDETMENWRLSMEHAESLRSQILSLTRENEDCLDSRNAWKRRYDELVELRAFTG